MNWKYWSLLLIGVVIAGSFGFTLSLIYSPQVQDEILNNDNQTGYDKLQQEYETLSNELGDLQEKYDQLILDHQELSENFDLTREEYRALIEDHEALRKEYNQTLEGYSSLLMQYLIITGSAPLSPQPVSNDTIRKDYAWSYSGKTWALNFYIPEYLYIHYKNKTRVPTTDYSVYVTHPFDDEYLSTIINKFKEIAREEGYDERETVNLVIAFVQSLPYTPDEVSTSFDEYPRYPVETLVDGGGDCEDTSILTSSLLDTMNYSVVLIDLPEHMAVGVNVDSYGAYWLHEGEKYFFIETTGEGWELGELPDEYQGEPAYIYPIIPIPICTHEWTASMLNHKLTLLADIRNVETAEASGVKLFAAFKDEEGEIWNSRESTFINLAVGEETTVMLELKVPRDMNIQIIVQVLDPWGNVIDESFSDWFETD